jgi:hypothetical protein
MPDCVACSGVCAIVKALSSLLRQHALVIRIDPAGAADCPFGGAVIASGLDDNRNGQRDDGEVTHTDYVCGQVAQLRVLALFARGDSEHNQTGNDDTATCP